MTNEGSVGRSEGEGVCHAQLRESSQRRSDVLARMSHDLRTPLNAIMGLAGLMQAGKAGPVTEAQNEYLGDILTSSDALLLLADEILDLARAEADHTQQDVDARPDK
jgi:signal transduction histidine kinase